MLLTQITLWLPHKEVQRGLGLCFQIFQLFQFMPRQMLKLGQSSIWHCPILRRTTYVERCPFTFKFNENNSRLVNKQYDECFQYWLESEYKVLNRYCGSLFLWHCTIGDLLDHFKQYLVKSEFDPNYLLRLSLDAPNVKLAFQEKLQKHLRDNLNKSLGTCSLHPVHTTFCRGITSVSFNLDQFFTEFHFFFRLSSA